MIQGGVVHKMQGIAWEDNRRWSKCKIPRWNSSKSSRSSKSSEDEEEDVEKIISANGQVPQLTSIARVLLMLVLILLLVLMLIQVLMLMLVLVLLLICNNNGKWRKMIIGLIVDVELIKFL